MPQVYRIAPKQSVSQGDMTHGRRAASVPSKHTHSSPRTKLTSLGYAANQLARLSMFET